MMHDLTLINPNSFEEIETQQNIDLSLSYWFNLYLKNQVMGSASKTIEAKKSDLLKFYNFFLTHIKINHIDYWTPAVSKLFQQSLINKPYSPATINRIFATLRNTCSWIDKQRTFLAGHPFNGVKDIGTDEPAWRGLTQVEITRLKIGCDHRIMICKKANQNPYMEAAIFYILLTTGMREFELVNINTGQYHSKAFHNVARKGKKITTKIYIPQETREKLDLYLSSRGPLLPKDPLFISRYNNRLLTRDVQRICKRIAEQASTHLPENDKIHLTPHMLRHTFLKKVADSQGVHVAQALSGNISMREIFRYTKPSQEDIAIISEDIANSF